MIRVELAGGRGHKAIGVVGAHQGQGWLAGGRSCGRLAAGPTPTSGQFAGRSGHHREQSFWLLWHSIAGYIYI